MRMIVAAFLTVVAVVPSVAAEEYSAGAWRGKSMVNDATGIFEGCAVGRENDTGGQLKILLYFTSGAVFEAPTLLIAVSSPSLRLIEGKTYPGEILVDGDGIGAEKEATSSAEGALMFFLTYKENYFEALSMGNVITAVMSRQRIAFPLQGSAEAIEWLRACTVRGATAGMMDRALSGRPSEPVDPGKISEESMRQILGHAGLTGYEMNPRTESGDIEHGWRWNGVGGMQFHLNKGGDDFEAIYAETAEYLPGDCIELPDLRKVDSKFPNGLAYSRLGYDCRDQQDLYRYALIMINDRTSVMVFMQFGKDAGTVEDADHRIFSVLEKLFE